MTNAIIASPVSSPVAIDVVAGDLLSPTTIASSPATAASSPSDVSERRRAADSANFNTISGSVYTDTDNDGNGNDPLAEVKIRLRDEDDQLVDVAYTDEKGSYTFHDVQPGTYSIVEDNPDGYEDAASTSPIKVTMTKGDNLTKKDFLDRPVGPPSTAPRESPYSVVTGHVFVENPADMSVQPLVGVILYMINVDTKQEVGVAGTNKVGYYEFLDINPGSYKIVQTKPDGYKSVNDIEGDPTDGTIFLTLTQGRSVNDNDFVDAPSANVEPVVPAVVPQTANLYVSGRVWADTDGNGDGDAVLPDVQVELKDMDGNTILTQNTDPNGLFEFFNVAPAKYQLIQTNLPGYTEVNDSQGGKTSTLSIDLTGGSSSYNNWFTDAPPANVVIEPPATNGALYVSGRVQADTNRDGVADEPLSGVVYTLENDQGRTAYYAASDEQGLFEFFDVEPGLYTLKEDAPPPGYTLVWDSVDGKLTDGDLFIDLTHGKSSYDNNFLFEPPDDAVAPTTPPTLAPAIVTGKVSEQKSDGNLAPLPGVGVYLKDEQENTIQVVFTDKNGVFNFTEPLASGEYVLVQDNSLNYVDVSDSEGDAYDSKINIEFVEGIASTNHQFIDRAVEGQPTNAPSNSPSGALPDAQPGTISGRVWADTNGDNIGDMALPGVKIDLQNEDGGLIDAGGTDEEGIFVFSNVPPGNYKLVETNFPGYADVSDSDGGDDNTISINLKNGGSSMDNVFIDKYVVKGAPLGIIAGTVFADVNHDGTGDQPMGSIRVDLLDRNGESLAMVGTSEEGIFVFHEIPSGSYLLTHSTPSGYSLVSDSDGGGDNLIHLFLLDGKSSIDNSFVDAPPPGVTFAATPSPFAKNDDDSIHASPSSPVPVPGTNDPPSVQAVEKSLAKRQGVTDGNGGGLSGGAIAVIVISFIVGGVVLHFFNKRRRNIRGSTSGSVASAAAFSNNFASRGSIS